MPVEIDETELQQLRSYEKVAKGLNSDARTREAYLTLIKTIAPNAPIPEIDAKRWGMQEMQKRDEKLAALEKELADSKTKLTAFEQAGTKLADIEKQLNEDKAAREKDAQDRKLTAHIDKGRQYLRDKQYTEDGITAVEKMMQERGLADYEAAEALFAKMQPPAEVAIPGASQRSWDLFAPEETAEESQKLLLANPKRWVAGEVPKILADIRGQARRS